VRSLKTVFSNASAFLFAALVFVIFTNLQVFAQAPCVLGTVNPSVTICAPADGATVTSPVRIVAGTTDSRRVTVMQIYLDGAKVYQVNARSLNTLVPMAVGTRRVAVQARDSAAKWFKQVIYINVAATQPIVSVNVSPASATIASGASKQFTATVSGTTNTGVTWSATGGTISTTGLYTAPSTAGTFSVRATSVADTSKSASANVTVSLSPPAIAVSPTSLAFNSIPATTTSSQAVVITNTGGSPLAISQATVTGAGVFTVAAPVFPFTLNAGQSGPVTIQFAPQAAGTFSGSLALVSNASNTLAAIPVSGTATTAPTALLSVSPTSLLFGNVLVGSTSTKTATLSNTGNSQVTVFSASTTGAGFTATGQTFPFTITPGANRSVSVQFVPQASGAANGSVSFTSNATNSPATVSVSGTGTVPVPHSVDLSWNASSVAVAGYNVYRGAQSGGPYTKLTAALQVTTNYSDANVQSGLRYFYVVTAVDTLGKESLHSNEAVAVIPSP